MTKKRFGLVLICCCFLFPRFILAALQNFTVDDAVLTGAVVPQYLPSTSDWNIGNECPNCRVQPDYEQAYNGTWHDMTYVPSNNITQTIQFNFTGSALYVFFILANTVSTDANTFTIVNFNLDGIVSASFQHNPSTSTAYEYNQPVYANDSLTNGLHTMTIEPVDTGSNVLVLFDYLVYTQDTGTTTSTDSASQAVTTTPSPTQTQSGSSGTPSGSNTGAIVGGVVAGVAVVVLVVAYALCYRPYKRRSAGQSTSANEAPVEPFIVSPTDPISSGSSSLPAHQVPWGSPILALASESQSKATRGMLSPTIQHSAPPVPVASNANGPLSGSGTSEMLEQMGLLRDEVARLRELQTQGRNLAKLDSEAPPEYYPSQ